MLVKARAALGHPRRFGCAFGCLRDLAVTPISFNCTRGRQRPPDCLEELRIVRCSLKRSVHTQGLDKNVYVCNLVSNYTRKHFL
jgi:hypothetical protein